VFTLIILGTGELVQLSGRAVGDSVSGGAMFFTGLIGLIGMIIAVGIGVWVSIRISIGVNNQKTNPSFTWWVVNRLAFMVGATNLAGFMVFFLQERFPEFSGEKAAGPAAQLVMFVGIFILLSALPSGWLADKFGRKPLVVAAGVLASLGTLVVIVSPTLTLMFVGGCLVGAGVGLFYSAN
ncbi:MAG: sugar porter family MFS transporter, partial [Gammaproteobacteria bacterium]|nr:sugar porter family MFS transporter [candidate division Zixibacteria bacterium]NIR92711.1 sugar porter family MFS transporter [Gammaproteobacteria bacterium]NIS47115.1 sugar porter family MFS transporter [candidate division Zixibacteria bacterium]NIU15254.1 sugar porter family MFS transporter [candidate division Zixibacteria bacterium]NIV07323.1 MFS transporter [candidate division Zixibacteria bacterium]